MELCLSVSRGRGGKSHLSLITNKGKLADSKNTCYDGLLSIAELLCIDGQVIDEWMVAVKKGPYL